MTKRPSTPTGSPSAKRQELPPSWHSAPSLKPSLGYEILKKIVEKIKSELPLETRVSDKPSRPAAVYWKAKLVLEEERYNLEGFVSQTQFEENLALQWPHFLEVVKRGIAEDASQADMEAVVFHSMCQCFYCIWMGAVKEYFLRGVLVVTTNKAHYS